MFFDAGKTIYAFMQAMGKVNDHLTGCFRAEEITRQILIEVVSPELKVFMRAK